jgi:hypothetical protein
MSEGRATWLLDRIWTSSVSRECSDRIELQLRDSAGLSPASPLCPGIRAEGHPCSEIRRVRVGHDNKALSAVQGERNAANARSL